MDPDPQRAAQDLTIRGICKHFGAVAVLRKVSLDVAGGEFVTLLGPSGCGKTTLLRIIAGLETADAGEVRLGSKSLDPLPANKRPVNMVFQNYALFPHLTAARNVAFGLHSRGTAADEAAAQVGRALEMLQITPWAGQYPHQLSGGQKQRVALARALVNEPAVLLLDEPMSALDAQLRAQVQVELRRLQRRLKRTFILVTHDQDEAMSVSDRIMVMRDGQIEQAGPPAEVYSRPRNRFVAEFLGAANLLTARRDDGRLHTALGPLYPDLDPPWRKGTLAIRPERITIVGEPPRRNGVRVRVKEVIYRGAHQELLVEPGPLRITAPMEPSAAVGDSFWVHLPPPSLVALED